jgi:hypothetical protein
MLHDFASMDTACINAFGRDIVFLPQAGGSIAGRGVFQRTSQPEGSAPGVYAVLFMRPDLLGASPARGDQVSVDGAVYKVFEIDADTEGAVVLRLRQAE